MAFIAWLITLIAGRLPASYHQAFTAVLRYEMRYYAYWSMLTPAYPGGLYGDKPGIPTWADQPAAPTGTTPPFEATPGYGTPESAYGTAPGGYGAPYSPYAAPGAGPGQGGYGYPADPGYGAPAGYGARPLFQPATWGLLLTSGAKKLVTTFIVLGAVLWAADIGLQIVKAHSEVNALVASSAIAELSASHATLNSQLIAWQNGTEACDKNPTCVTGEDATAASDFSAFASRLQDIPLPASAVPAGARLYADATKMAQDFTALSLTVGASQYQSTYASTGFVRTLTQFNTDYSALGNELSGV
jgi:hypothetical protein